MSLSIESLNLKQELYGFIRFKSFQPHKMTETEVTHTLAFFLI